VDFVYIKIGEVCEFSALRLVRNYEFCLFSLMSVLLEGGSVELLNFILSRHG